MAGRSTSHKSILGTLTGVLGLLAVAGGALIPRPARGAVVNYGSVPYRVIPDGGSVSDTIDVPDSGILHDVNVTVTIQHPQIGDLGIELTDPTGTVRAQLVWTEGGPADGLKNVTFDDEAPGLPPDFLVNGTCLVGRSYQPAPDRLSDFDGMRVHGAWTLTITDVTTGDASDCDCDGFVVGPPCPRTLDGWSIEIDFTPGPIDSDGDGVADDGDNCPLNANPEQADLDADGLGDVCDPDDDGDGVVDASDNCPRVANPDQTDSDGDLAGDVCDPDDDNDGAGDPVDNCPFTVNPDQLDLDGDGLGDACDADADGDGVTVGDNCPRVSNPGQDDNDADGAGDVCDSDDDDDLVCDGADDVPGVCLAGPDNCPTTDNPEQTDLDGDGIGDACDADLDGDGLDNAGDNCSKTPNPGQDDTDLDGDGDACDADDDADGICDGAGAADGCAAGPDNCQLLPNLDQADLDGDGSGDACDGDLDGDGFDNDFDNCPAAPNASQNDFDGDGLGDACDGDRDDDAVANEGDLCDRTPAGEVVDPGSGCSVAQLCPCAGPRGTTAPWLNHGKHVSCVAKSAESLVEQGLLSPAEKDALVAAAATLRCGRKKK